LAHNQKIKTMPKQATRFPHGKLNIFGRDIPLKRNGGLNMVYLTLEERKIYFKFLEVKKLKNEQSAMASLKDAFL
jgi:hypothetical protein